MHNATRHYFWGMGSLAVLGLLLILRLSSSAQETPKTEGDGYSTKPFVPKNESFQPFKYILYGTEQVSLLYYTFVSGSIKCNYKAVATGKGPIKQGGKTQSNLPVIKSANQVLFGTSGYRADTKADIIAKKVYIHNSGGTILGNISAEKVDAFSEWPGGWVNGAIKAQSVSFRNGLFHQGKISKEKFNPAPDEWVALDRVFSSMPTDTFKSDLIVAEKLLKLPSDNYFYTGITITSKAGLEISGPAQVFVKGNLIIQPDATLKVVGADIDIFVLGRILISDNASVNPDGCAHQLALIHRPITYSTNAAPVRTLWQKDDLVSIISDYRDCLDFLLKTDRNAANYINGWLSSLTQTVVASSFPIRSNYNDANAIRISNARIVQAGIYAPGSMVVITQGKNNPAKNVINGSIIANNVSLMSTVSATEGQMVKNSPLRVEMSYPLCMADRKIFLPEVKLTPKPIAKPKIKTSLPVFKSVLNGLELVTIQQNSNISGSQPALIPGEKLKWPLIKGRCVAFYGSGYNGTTDANVQAESVIIVGATHPKLGKGRINGTIFSSGPVFLGGGVELGNICAPQVIKSENNISSLWYLWHALFDAVRYVNNIAYLNNEMLRRQTQSFVSQFPQLNLDMRYKIKGNVFKQFPLVNTDRFPAAECHKPDDLPASQGVCLIEKDQSVSLSGLFPYQVSEDMVFDNVELNESAVLTITQPGNIYILGHLNLEPNARLIIESGPVNIYINGSLLIKEKAQIKTLASPADLAIIANVVRVDVLADARISGGLYAPNSEVNIFERVKWDGAIVAEKLNLKAGMDKKNAIFITYAPEMSIRELTFYE